MDSSKTLATIDELIASLNEIHESVVVQNGHDDYLEDKKAAAINALQRYEWYLQRPTYQPRKNFGGGFRK